MKTLTNFRPPRAGDAEGRWPQGILVLVALLVIVVAGVWLIVEGLR